MKWLRPLWLLVCLFSLLRLCADAQSDCDPSPSGIISWWPAEGNAVDVISGNNGTLENGGAFGPGEVGQAFTFNGANQYVSIPDSPSLHPASMTVEGWLNFNAIGGGQQFAGKPYGGGDSDSWAVWFESSQMYAEIATTGGEQPALGYAWAAAAGTWHHVAYTFDAGASYQTLYVDGAVVDSGACSGPIAYDTNPLLIGGDINGGAASYFFDGSIDEVSLYSRALTETEVESIYEAGSAGKCMPPVIVVPPASQIVTEGNSVTFTVSANGAAPLAYQWQFNGTNLTDDAQITGSQSNVLILTSVTMDDTGTYQVLVTNISGSTNASATLTVQATPIITWTNPAAIMYGTPLDTNQLNATANVPGSFVYNPAAGTVLNTGTNTLSVIFTPTDTVDYTNATDTVSVAVLPTPLTVTAANASQPYGQISPVFTGTITGLQNGDNITATYGCNATTNSPVGTYAITPMLVDPGDLQTNYTVTLINGTLTITMAVPLLTWTNPAPIAYGNPLTSNQLNATANVPGSFVYNPAAGTVLNTGTNTLSVIFTPTDTVDYTNATDTVSAVVVIFGQNGCYPSPSGIISWWPGEGNAVDVISGNNGTLENGTAFGLGEVGQAFLFNGVNQYVSVPDSPSLHPASMTVEGWLNFNAIGGGQQFAGKPYGGGNSDSWAVWFEGSQMYAEIATTGGEQPALGYAWTAAAGTWHHVAYTFDAIASYQALYVDGAVVDSGACSGPIAYDSNPLLIGGDINSGAASYFFDGSIDEVSLYSRALTQTEVESIYEAGSAGKCMPPVIVVPPASQIVTASDPVTFTVSASGAPPLAYQWQFNGTNLTDDAQITGSQSNVLILTSVTMDDTGTYQVLVTNISGSTNASATLTVNQATPIITWTNPAAITYGTPLDTNQLNATANVPGSFAYNPLAGNVLNAGTYLISLIFTPTDPVNYSSVTDSVSLLVSPSPLTVEAANASRLYDQTNPVFTGTITGVTNGDNITPLYSTAATIDSLPGTYNIVSSLVDPNNRQANYTVNLVNGTLTVEPIPTILNQPQNQIALVETNITFSVTATNTAPAIAPLNYQWQFSGTNIANATNPTISLPSVSLNQSGNYQVIVANPFLAVTSTPAMLDVRPIFVSVSGSLLTGTNYTFIGPTTVSFVTGYTNGSMFYTLDGSQPSFLTSYYQAPFKAEQSCLLRAVAYSADFSQYGEMPPIAITIIPVYAINYLPSPGGSVSASPSNSPYVTGSLVTLQANPNPGWTFLDWLGDGSGGNTNVTLTMDSGKTVQAIFGTSLGETVAGNGTVAADPSSTLYPYGTTVRLTANPAPGNAFATWGNAAAGISTNPLYFTITNAAPVISALFVSLPGNAASLTIQTSGNGRVRATPQANTYSLNSIVALTAIPNAGQQFLGWSGAASGSSTNFSLTMNQSKTVIATFSQLPSLSVAAPLNGLFNSGFRLTITSDFGAVCDLEASTNLPNWYSIITITNTYGTAQFTDPEATTNHDTFYRLILPQ
jgi:hypothetical protein